GRGDRRLSQDAWWRGQDPHRPQGAARLRAGAELRPGDGRIRPGLRTGRWLWPAARLRPAAWLRPAARIWPAARIRPGTGLRARNRPAAQLRRGPVERAVGPGAADHPEPADGAGPVRLAGVWSAASARLGHGGSARHRIAEFVQLR